MMWDHWWRDDNVCQMLSKFAPPKQLLDIGCGNGHTLELIKIYFPDAKLYGIDVSDAAIELAKRRVPDGTFYCGQFELVELPQKYDRIISLGVMEHLYDTHEALMLVKDYLTDDGIFYIEVPENILETDPEEWKISFAGDQIEWHRHRDTWERFIITSGYEILEYKHHKEGYNYSWVLK